MDDVRTTTLEALQEAGVWEWPPDARATLLSVLADRDVDLDHRVLAAELSSEVAILDDELAARLLALLRAASEPEGLRAQAAVSLGPMLEYADMEGYEDDDEPSVTPPTIEKTQTLLRATYFDASAPTFLRRRALEASVRGCQAWHADVIAAAWASGDPAWQVTAVFCMQYVAGFERQIAEALESQVPEIFLEAVRTAGERGMADAWPRVSALLTAPGTPKPLLLAAIDASPNINSEQAVELLEPLTRSDDEDIAAAAEEAIVMAEAEFELGDGDDDLDDEDDEDDPTR
jgi:hypothetical protein